MTRAAIWCARVAGVAWLIGFALSLLVGASIAIGNRHPAPLIFGFLMFGLWVLVLGVLLLRRPGPGVLVASLTFAAILLILYAPFRSSEAADLWYWLSFMPDATAGVSSLVGLVIVAWHRVSGG